MRPAEWLTVALCALFLALGLALMASPAWAYPYVTWSVVNDRPLLETVDQVRDARLYGVCAFRIGSEYFVVENLPREYVDYSAACVRMP